MIQNQALAQSLQMRVKNNDIGGGTLNVSTVGMTIGHPGDAPTPPLDQAAQRTPQSQILGGATSLHSENNRAGVYQRHKKRVDIGGNSVHQTGEMSNKSIAGRELSSPAVGSGGPDTEARVGTISPQAALDHASIPSSQDADAAHRHKRPSSE